VIINPKSVMSVSMSSLLLYQHKKIHAVGLSSQPDVTIDDYAVAYDISW